MLIQTLIVIIFGLYGLYYFGRTAQHMMITVLIMGYIIAIAIVLPVSRIKRVREWWYCVWD